MTGRRVQLFLKTPLFRFFYEEDGRTKRFPAGIVFVEGTVHKEKGGGLWITPEAIGDGEREPSRQLCGLGECIIPLGKVDFIRFVGGAPASSDPAPEPPAEKSSQE